MRTHRTWAAAMPALALVLGLALASPSEAAAQTIDWQAQRADAGYVADVGMGLTIAGLATVGLGTGVVFGFPLNWGALIGGSVLWGIGGLLGLAGIPTWIVGGVRSNIADATDETRAGTASDWEHAGTAVFFTSVGAAVLGGALMALGVGIQDSGTAIAGAVLVPVGVFVALFIGAPMWAEGARF